MEYSLSLPLPQDWVSEEERYEEVDGAVITHLSCQKQGGEYAAIELYIGDMPSDTTAEDEAFANYADMIGWDDDEESENPIGSWKFQNKTAYGFSGEDEDGNVMLFSSCEIKQGVLLISCVMAKNDQSLSDWSKYLEMHLRIRK